MISSPMMTAGVGVTVAMLGGAVVWLAQVLHLPVPPTDVACTLAALGMAVAHKAAIFVNSRWPAKVAPAA